MNSTERVRNTILGKPVDRQPIYGWVAWNMEEKINRRWGSAAAMEDYYEFDAAHIFGGPYNSVTWNNNRYRIMTYSSTHSLT